VTVTGRVRDIIPAVVSKTGSRTRPVTVHGGGGGASWSTFHKSLKWIKIRLKRKVRDLLRCLAEKGESLGCASNHEQRVVSKKWGGATGGGREVEEGGGQSLRDETECERC